MIERAEERGRCGRRGWYAAPRRQRRGLRVGSERSRGSVKSEASCAAARAPNAPGSATLASLTTSAVRRSAELPWAAGAHEAFDQPLLPASARESVRARACLVHLRSASFPCSSAMFRTCRCPPLALSPMPTAKQPDAVELIRSNLTAGRGEKKEQTRADSRR